MKAKSCKLPAVYIALIVLDFIFALFFVCQTHAFSTSISAYSQGATLTEKYYVYTTCSGSCGSFKIHRCDRPSGNNCKTLGSYSGKPSSMYHEWGTNYAQAILKENSGMYCFKLDPFEKVSNSNCGSMLKSSGLNFSGDNSKVRQGWAAYGKCYLRGYGNNGGMTNYIYLYNSKKDKIKEWVVPHSGGEIEDVMSDGSGQIYYTYAITGVKVHYYEMDSSTSKEWAKKCKTGGSSSSDESSSSGSSNSGSSLTDGFVATDSNSGGSSDSGSTDSSSSGSSYTYTPAESTYNGEIDTIFFGTIKDDGSGCGVYSILGLVFQILTIGVGILAVLGITIFGINYLTAAGDVTKATKAKHRIFEIILGLAIYAVLYSALNFLIPEFNPEIKTCNSSSTTTSSKK